MVKSITQEDGDRSNLKKTSEVITTTSKLDIVILLAGKNSSRLDLSKE